MHVGWISEVGKFETFDEECDRAGFPKVTIRHGEGKLVTHWDLCDPQFFVMCDGLQSWREAQNTPDRYGIAMGWYDRVDEITRKKNSYSIVKAKVFLRALCEADVFIPLVLSVKRLFTQDLLACFGAHLDVLDVAEEMAKQKGQDKQFPFYAFDIALLPGENVQRGGEGRSKDVAPISTNIPVKDQIDRDFLVSRMAKKTWIEEIESRMDAVVQWSVDVSAAIKAGNDV
jgi:hypothetical protein